MKQAISLKEALQIIETKDVNGFPVAFDIGFRTLNKNSKSGGALRTLQQASVLTSLPKRELTNQQKLDNLLIASKPRKKPSHFLNRTRNLKKANGEIAKVHIRLITDINHQNVEY
jgi:hypothetical protein